MCSFHTRIARAWLMVACAACALAGQLCDMHHSPEAIRARDLYHKHASSVRGYHESIHQKTTADAALLITPPPAEDEEGAAAAVEEEAPAAGGTPRALTVAEAAELAKANLSPEPVDDAASDATDGPVDGSPPSASLTSSAATDPKIKIQDLSQLGCTASRSAHLNRELRLGSQPTCLLSQANPRLHSTGTTTTAPNTNADRPSAPTTQPTTTRPPPRQSSPDRSPPPATRRPWLQGTPEFSRLRCRVGST